MIPLYLVAWGKGLLYACFEVLKLFHHNYSVCFLIDLAINGRNDWVLSEN